MTHKAVLIDELTNDYQTEVAAYNALPPGKLAGTPKISLNLIEPSVGVVQFSALQDLVFRIPSTTSVMRIAAILAQRNATLNGHLSQRNELIRAMRVMKEPDRTALYFGLPAKDGYTDKTYPHLVNSLSELTSDCIFFSWMMCELLQSEGIDICKERKWLPAIVSVNFQRQVTEGLIPNPDNYRGWHNLAPRWRELALPFYKKYAKPEQQPSGSRGT